MTGTESSYFITMALYSVYTVCTVFLFCIGITPVRPQGCNSCYSEFSTDFNDLQGLLENSIRDMVELNKMGNQAGDNWKQCTGISVAPSSAVPTKPVSNQPSWVPLSTIPNGSPPTWVPGSTKTTATPSGQTPSWVQATTTKPTWQSDSSKTWVANPTTPKQSGSDASNVPGLGSTLPTGVSTTEGSSTNSRLIIGIVLGAAFGCLLLFTVLCWCVSSRGGPGVNSLQSLPTQKSIGYGQFPPVQERNPYVFSNRYYQGAINM